MAWNNKCIRVNNESDKIKILIGFVEKLNVDKL